MMEIDSSPSAETQDVYRVVRDEPLAAARTILVFGPARSGTSMVAGILHDLGIPTNHKTPTFEDHVLGRAADENDWERVQRIIRLRNRESDVWAWKRPRLGEYLETVQPWLRSPRLIVTFKNPMAIARRKVLSGDMLYLDALVVAATTLRHAAKLCSRYQLPLLLVNHDTAQGQHALCVEAIARFVGVDDPERIAHALARVEANRERYQRRREVTREEREKRQAARGTE